MSVNKDLNYAFALSRQCLRILGVWPDPHKSLRDIRRPSIRFIIVTCILCFYVIVPQMTNMIRAWGNIARMIEYISSANFSVMALCKLIATWYHSKTLQKLITSCVEDWMTSKSNWERNTMLKIVKRGRNLSFRCYATVTITLTFHIYLVFMKYYANKRLSQWSLVYQFSFPYNVQKSPNYEITYFIQFCGGIYAAFINCSVDNFVSLLVLHICAQLINLRITLNNLVNGLANKSTSSTMYKEGLSAFIVRHEYLIRNAKTIDSCYSTVLFVHMLAATFQLCFETFQFFTIITGNLNVSIFKMAFLLCYALVVLTHMYMYCYSAERLLTESTNMAYGVYECKWYDLPSKEAKDLMFIVYRSTIPLRLTAGKFGIFSLEMFGTTLKTSMGYLSALMTIKD